MAANPTKAQVKKRFDEAGIVQPSLKLEGEALTRHLNQRSVKFESKSDRRLRTRSAKKKFAIRDF